MIHILSAIYIEPFGAPSATSHSNAYAELYMGGGALKNKKSVPNNQVQYFPLAFNVWCFHGKEKELDTLANRKRAMVS